MKSASKPSVTIIGAGLTGCFLAIILAERGYTVSVYEKQLQDRLVKNSSKRSFNLTFFDYGMQALQRVGVWETLEPFITRLDGSVTEVGVGGKEVAATFDSHTHYYTVQRADLVRVLIERASELANVTFHFGYEVLSVDRDNRKILFRTESGNEETVSYDLLFGTDGVHSKIREVVQEGQAGKHIQTYSDWGYKQISIDATLAERLGLEKRVMYAWTRKNAVLTAFPGNDGGYSAMFLLPKNGAVSFADLKDSEAVSALFKKYFPRLLPAIDAISEQVLTNPEGNLVMLDSSPWAYKEILVIGDAAHGFFPFYGMGMSAGFGDCLELVRLLDLYDEDWKEVFAKFEDVRKKHTDALAYLSAESFKRFQRERRADYVAIYDRIESLLSSFFPKVFQPELFALVSVYPDNSGEYLQQHRRQRARSRWLALPVAVGLLTAAVWIYEIIEKRVKR